MTNGEKMKVVFTDIEMWGESKDTLDYSLDGMIHRVTKRWWNAEYKEPTTKNDLGVLDKIRAEVEKAIWEDVIVSLDGTDEIRIPLLDPDDVFEIIDRYRNEVSE